eukprot:2288335-Pleurochrysis_carterae.AAC.1
MAKMLGYCSTLDSQRLDCRDESFRSCQIGGCDWRTGDSPCQRLPLHPVFLISRCQSDMYRYVPFNSKLALDFLSSRCNVPFSVHHLQTRPTHEHLQG